jgi:iron complex transport system substrate-binding protein
MARQMTGMVTRVVTAAAAVASAATLFVAPLGAQQRGAQASAPRIVSLGGSITEIVFALGLGANVVGVDGSSHVPAQVEKLPKVGAMFRAIPAEGVLALRPTVVIGTADVGPASAVEQIKSAGVTVTLVPVAESVDGALAKIRAVATALGESKKGEALATSVAADVAKARALAASATSSPKALFIYARGGGTLLVSGTASPADAMITLANGRNAITDFKGFKPLTAEAVIAAAPDVIVIPTHGLESIGGVDGLLKLPGIALTPAGKNKHVVAMDDELLLGFGPRVGQGIRTLAIGMHPELRRTASESAPGVR